MKKVHHERATKPENVIYKDENVIVSRLSLQVRQALYPLENISDCHVASIPPNRTPAIVMIVIGAALAGTAYKGLIPTTLFENLPPLQEYSSSLSYPTLIELIGGSLAIIGLFALLMARRMHTLRINMGGNVMDVIATRRRDYVKKIAVAMGIALRNIPLKSYKADTSPVQPPYTYSELN